MKQSQLANGNASIESHDAHALRWWSFADYAQAFALQVPALGGSPSSLQWPGALLSPLQALWSRLAGQSVMIACSGGVDSAILACAAQCTAPSVGVRLHLLHVDHGLDPSAQQWAASSGQLASWLGVPAYVAQVQVDRHSGLGLEAAARHARYHAYTVAAQRLRAPQVLLAHHLNDQAETLLLRLLRGSGVAGMQGMAAHRSVGGLSYHRPWLAVPRSALRDMATQLHSLTGWTAVQDPSNTDPKFARGALRRDIVPALRRHFPQWKSQLVRHAALMQEAQCILDEVAAQDWQFVQGDDTGFALQPWRQLPEYRQSHVLRYFLQRHGLAMPSQRRLADWLRQLRQVHQLGTDRQLQFLHQGRYLRLQQGYLRIG